MTHGQNAPVNLTVQSQQPPLLVRVLWFLFVGWWASGIAITLAYLFMVTIVLIPLGIWLLHRVPQIQTLRDRSREFILTREPDGSTTVRTVEIPQRPFLVRALWFVFIGWWLSALWLAIAWLISLPVITLPISVVMIDRTPGMLTLQRH